MSGFTKYPKIQAIYKDEVDGSLQGRCHVFEKLDGANASVWLDNHGEVRMGSRNNDVTDGNFRGFTQYIREREDFSRVLAEHPNWYLYGEWLVKHSIAYNDDAYYHFYLFDVWDKEKEKFLHYDEWSPIIGNYDIRVAPFLGVYENPTIDSLKVLAADRSEHGPEREGIVIKNYDFINKYGQLRYAKIVSSRFKETKILKRDTSGDIETKIANDYVTYARIEKIANKMVTEKDRKLDRPDTGEIIGRVYHDVITEDMWEILRKNKRATIDFGRLQKACSQITSREFKEYLEKSV